MDTFELENEEVTNMVNKNAIKRQQEAIAISRINKREKIRHQRKQSQERLVLRAMAYILAATTLTGAIGITHHITKESIKRDNVVISIEEANTIIDQKIKEYISLMDLNNNDINNKIEVMVGRNLTTAPYEPQVYYKEENLAKHIVEAAKISESEVRCVIIAAYKIINEPYINQTISEALRQASTMQDENAVYKIPSNSKELLEELGYENWDEYALKERRAIKDLYTILEYANNPKGRTM